MQKHHTSTLTRRLTILFMLIAILVALSTDRSVQKVKAYATCTEQCQIDFGNCWLTAPTPGAKQRCYEKSIDCIEYCQD